MDISCAFPPTPSTPDFVALAESLGYRRAWVYDTPALQLDVWMTLALAATRTSRIGLGPGVLIPSLRHPLVTAAAIATLVQLAPARVAVGVGSGFTGRFAMGQRALPWATVASYVSDVQALLRGETVVVDGAMTRMLHGPGQAPPRPITVPWVIGAEGPRGQAVARELGDGLFSTTGAAGFDWTIRLAFGTVLEDGEDPGNQRVLAAAGPGAAVTFHGLHEWGNPLLAALPGSDTWGERLAAVPEGERHLHVHEGHLTFVNDLDRGLVGGDLVSMVTFTGTAQDLRGRIDDMARQGITEVAYQPCGPDIERELRAFMAMAQ
jgi:5,10-methylenetetrahydromethanopterin reductase